LPITGCLLPCVIHGLFDLAQWFDIFFEFPGVSQCSTNVQKWVELPVLTGQLHKLCGTFRVQVAECAVDTWQYDLWLHAMTDFHSCQGAGGIAGMINVQAIQLKDQANASGALIAVVAKTPEQVKSPMRIAVLLLVPGNGHRQFQPYGRKLYIRGSGKMHPAVPADFRKTVHIEMVIMFMRADKTSHNPPHWLP
jgi:hypothetical protein